MGKGAALCGIKKTDGKTAKGVVEKQKE